jgi:hypothetical protein
MLAPQFRRHHPPAAISGSGVMLRAIQYVAAVM